jgi:glutaminase
MTMEELRAISAQLKTGLQRKLTQLTVHRRETLEADIESAATSRDTARNTARGTAREREGRSLRFAQKLEEMSKQTKASGADAKPSKEENAMGKADLKVFARLGLYAAQTPRESATTRGDDDVKAAAAFEQAAKLEKIVRGGNQARPSQLGTIPISAIEQALDGCGLKKNDQRLKDAHQDLKSVRLLRGEEINFTDFQTIKSHNLLLDKALSGALVVPNFESFTASVREVFDETRSATGGDVARYIPQLARVEPEQYGVAVCSVDGQRWSHGDSKVPFCIQSTSKPLTYAMALELHGEEKVHMHIGQEPSGRNFNSRVLLNTDREKGPSGHGGTAVDYKQVPHNPCINAGAIMAASLVKGELAESDRFDYVMSVWRKLTGNGHVDFQNSTYMGEKCTAARNFCLGYMMAEEEAFPEENDLMKTLESYFMYCSIEMDTEAMSVVAATLANGGVCPTTGERVFKAKTVQRTLALVQSCGMYDYSGEFAFKVGFPSKSGVSGVLCIIIPGVMGIATFSPRLDDLGNSVRGLAFCKGLNNRFPFHMFASLGNSSASKGEGALSADAIRCGINFSGNAASSDGGDRNSNSALSELWFAASTGELARVQQLVAGGIDVNFADYDQRSALHLAASNGHNELVRYLLLVGADPTKRDLLEHTAADDNEREGNASVKATLAAHAAAESTADSSLRRLKIDPGVQNVPRLYRLFMRRLLISSALVRPKTAVTGRIFHRADLVETLQLAGVGVDDIPELHDGSLPKCFNNWRFMQWMNHAARWPQRQKQAGHLELDHTIAKALCGQLRVPNFKLFRTRLGRIFERAKQADIPVDCDKYAHHRVHPPSTTALGVCTIDGQTAKFGDADARFAIKELCWPVLYCAAQEKRYGGPGLEAYHANVGREPQPADATDIELNPDGKPFNPLTMSAAISISSLLYRQAAGAKPLQPRQKLRELLKLWSSMQAVRGSGGGERTLGAVCEDNMAKQSVDYANKALCMIFMMMESHAIEQDLSPEEQHEFHSLCQSIESDVSRLSIAAAVLASGGVHPITRERVLEPATVKNCLSMMHSTGMGTMSGQHAFRCGFPAKSSSGGAVMVVIPNVMGACFFSPSGLNRQMQPSRALVFCSLLVNCFNFHQYDNINRGVEQKSNPLSYTMTRRDQYTVQLLKAASEGDMMTIRLLQEFGVDMASVDYDLRSAMHVAATNCEPEAMRFLATHGGRINCKDRWDNTPLDDAVREGHTELVKQVKQWGTANGLTVLSGQATPPIEFVSALGSGDEGGDKGVVATAPAPAGAADVM